MFVEHEGVTVRIRANGECGLSPITFSSLEWDLRTEPPHTWDYVAHSDLDEDTWRKIEQIVLYVQNILKMK